MIFPPQANATKLVSELGSKGLSMHGLGIEPLVHRQFEAQVMPLRHAAYNLAFWLLGNREEAEDAVQDAYVRALRAFPAFRGEAVKPWLLTIVRNVAYSAIAARKRARSVIVSAEDYKASSRGDVIDRPCQAPSPEAATIAAAELQQLTSALGKLPLRSRDILVLRELEDLSYAEIARVTDTPIGTVMSRLSRARAQLRKALQSSTAGN